jgi:hypothetical protein
VRALALSERTEREARYGEAKAKKRRWRDRQTSELARSTGEGGERDPGAEPVEGRRWRSGRNFWRDR